MTGLAASYPKKLAYAMVATVLADRFAKVSYNKEVFELETWPTHPYP